PLHISYLHDGNPSDPITHTFTKGKKAGQKEELPKGKGVHSAYEDKMIFDNRKLILEGLKHTPAVKKTELVGSGREAAKLTIDLMRNTFALLPPRHISTPYVTVVH